MISQATPRKIPIRLLVERFTKPLRTAIYCALKDLFGTNLKAKHCPNFSLKRLNANRRHVLQIVQCQRSWQKKYEKSRVRKQCANTLMIGHPSNGKPQLVTTEEEHASQQEAAGPVKTNETLSCIKRKRYDSNFSCCKVARSYSWALWLSDAG